MGGRAFVQSDVGYNITGIISTSGSVIERFVYSPYGQREIVDSSWAETTDIAGVPYGFEGGRSVSANLLQFGVRDYDSVTAIWKQQDPGMYVDGSDRYKMEKENPELYVDPTGYCAGAIAWRVAGWAGATVAEIAGGGPEDPLADAAAIEWLQWTYAMAAAATVASALPHPASYTSRGNYRNEYSDRAIQQAKKLSTDPCTLLRAWYTAARAEGDNVAADKIKKAQKVLGCRENRSQQ